MTSSWAIGCWLTVSAMGAPPPTPLVEKLPLQAAGFRTYWEADLPLTRGDTVEDAYLVEDALYVITDLGDVFALTAEVGLLRWGLNVTEPDYRIFRPTHAVTQDNAGPVVIPTVTDVVVLDRFSGEKLQRFRPEFAAGSSAVAFEHYLFMGSSNGRFYSLIFNHPRFSRPIKNWEVMATGPVTASPLLYDRGWLLFADQSGTVFSCVATTKKLNWSYRTGGPIVAGPAVDSTGVYVAGTDRSLYKLHRSNGAPLWRVRFPDPLRESPIAVEETVYQYCAKNGLTALNAADGAQRWNHPTARGVASHTPGGAVVFTTERRLEIVDPATGEVNASIFAPQVKMTVSNTKSDAVYLIGDAGRILCLRLDEVPYLRRQQVRAARDQLNHPPTTRKPERIDLKAARPGAGDLPLSDDPLRSKKDRSNP